MKTVGEKKKRHLEGANKRSSERTCCSRENRSRTLMRNKVKRRWDRNTWKYIQINIFVNKCRKDRMERSATVYY